MDLTPDEAQRDLTQLAAQILGDAAGRGTAEPELWRTLADAGLLGTAVPEELGGLGLGFAEVGLLLEEAGRVATTAPLWAALTSAAAIGAHGTGQQRRALLAPLARGETVPAVALGRRDGNRLPPSVHGTGDRDGGWTLRGGHEWVPSAPQATHLLVHAQLDGVGRRLVLLDPAAPGLVVEARTGTGGVFGRLHLDGVRAGANDVLGGPDGAEAVPAAARYAAAGACAVVAGALAAVVRLTADYTRTREQFDRPIGSFQAVGQRIADAYTASWSVQLTARQACWALAGAGAGATGTGTDGAREVAVAGYTATTAGQQVIRAAHHLHGGIGMDRDYPLSRYTLLVKRLELLLGGASAQAAALGDLLAAGAPVGVPA